MYGTAVPMTTPSSPISGVSASDSERFVPATDPGVATQLAHPTGGDQHAALATPMPACASQ